jgi:hypothetical protein
MYHKVAECRTEKWQPMNLLSVIDPSASLFSYQEVCTTQVHHSRGARNDAQAQSSSCWILSFQVLHPSLTFDAVGALLYHKVADVGQKNGSQ